MGPLFDPNHPGRPSVLEIRHMRALGFVTAREVAELFGVSSATVHMWKKRGLIPYEMYKGFPYFELAEMQKRAHNYKPLYGVKKDPEYPE